MCIALVLTGCLPASGDVDLCAEMADRCGAGDARSWGEWCNSECIPTFARTHRCAANDVCLLCDEPRGDGQATEFGLPNEFEFLWTMVRGTDPGPDPVPPHDPTGHPFDDQSGTWSTSPTGVGSWRIYQPYDVMPFEPRGFCEPGPSQFLSSNVHPGGDAVVLSAERAPDALYCPFPSCPSGPYPDCGATIDSACEYHDTPETSGSGTSAQLDRMEGGALATYGYGHYRSIQSAGTDAAPPAAGFSYAMFVQSNEYCVDGVPNPGTNTGEIDIEISSGVGYIDEAGTFCDETQMCFELVTWTSSPQGLAMRNMERRETTGFRFRDRATAGQRHTWGWDWAPDDVRFTYDADPSDCDEHGGACPPEHASIAICEHTHFVPNRPAPMHLQLWSARWAGVPPEGTQAEMRFERVWHQPEDH